MMKYWPRFLLNCNGILIDMQPAQYILIAHLIRNGCDYAFRKNYMIH